MNHCNVDYNDFHTACYPVDCNDFHTDVIPVDYNDFHIDVIPEKIIDSRGDSRVFDRIIKKDLKLNLKNKTMYSINLLECFKYVFNFQYEDKKETKFGTIQLVAKNMSEAQRMFDRLYSDSEKTFSPEPKLHVTSVSETPYLS